MRGNSDIGPGHGDIFDPAESDPEMPGNGLARAKGLDLTGGPIMSTTVKLAIPVIISHLLNLAIGIADIIMVGALGKEALAALVMSNALLNLLFALGWGMCFAVITHVSQHTGAGRHARARRSASHAIMFAIALGFVMIVVGNLFLSELFRPFNAQPDVTEAALSYTGIVFDWMPFFFLIFLGGAIMQGLGDTLTPMIIMFFINVINILLNYALIFGAWGFPELGIAGAAVGTVTARGVGSLVGLLLLLSGAYRIVLRIPDFKPYLDEFWGILRLGIPNSLQSLLRNVNVILLYSILSLTYLPTVAQASLGVGFHAEAIAFIPLMGLFIATGTMVGQNLGAEKSERAEEASWASLKVAFVLMVIACLAFLLIPERIVSLFIRDPAVVSSGSWYLRINAITQIFQSCFVLVGCLRGAGDSIRPLSAHITGQWIIRLPLAYLLVRYSGLEEWGVWLAMATSSAIESTIYFWLFRKGDWKRIRISTGANLEDVD